MNRYYHPIQKAIGLVGDRISKEHQMARALAEVRELPDSVFADAKKQALVDYILGRAAEALGVPKEILLADEDVDRN